MYNFEKLSPAAKLWHFYHKIATLHRPVMILLSLQTFWRPQNWVKPSLSLSQKLPFSQQHVLINLKPLIILVVKKVNMMILLMRVVAILTCLFFTLNWLTLTLRHICTILPRDWLLKWAGEWQKAHLKVLRGAIGEQNKAKERKPPILRGAQNCSPIAIEESD